MTITIDATVGGASANAFVTEVEQIAYMATRLNASTWTTVSGTTCTNTEKQAMVEASRELSAMAWLGTRTDTTQFLSWPRFDVPDPDSPSGFLYSSAAIPQRVKDATCELAFQFLKLGTEDLAAADPNAGVIESTVDVLTTRWESVSSRPQGLRRFTRMMRWIGPLLADQPGVLQLVRG